MTFACLTLIASQIFLYVLTIDAIFREKARARNSSPLNFASVSNYPEVIYLQVIKIQRMLVPCWTLIWTSIFAVKICFLLFFYQIIIRLQNFMRAWKVIFGITIFIWAFCICEFAIDCPYFDQRICSRLHISYQDLIFIGYSI